MIAEELKISIRAEATQAISELNKTAAATKENTKAFAAASAQSQTATAGMKAITREAAPVASAMRATAKESTAAAGALDKTGKESNEAATAAKKMSSGFKQAGSEFERVSTSSKNTTASIMKMAKQIIGAAGLVYAFNKLKRATTEFVRSSIDTAAAIEKQRTAFEVLLKSADAGRQLMDDVVAFSARTPFVVSELTSVTQVLIATGTEASEVTRVLENLGNAAMGDSAKLARLADAYSKLQTKGRASLEEINRFTEAGVPILAALQEQYGVTREELFKYISAGKVGFADVDMALRAMTEGQGDFAGMLEKQSKTLSGLLSTLQGEVDLVKAAWVEAFLPSIKIAVDGAIVKMGEFRDRVTQWADDNRDTITTVFTNFPQVAGLAFEAAKEVMAVIFSPQNLADMLTQLATAMTVTLSSAIASLPDIWEDTLKLMAALWDELIKPSMENFWEDFKFQGKNLIPQLGRLWRGEGLEKPQTSDDAFGVLGGGVLGELHGSPRDTPQSMSARLERELSESIGSLGTTISAHLKVAFDELKGLSLSDDTTSDLDAIFAKFTASMESLTVKRLEAEGGKAEAAAASAEASAAAAITAASAAAGVASGFSGGATGGTPTRWQQSMMGDLPMAGLYGMGFSPSDIEASWNLTGAGRSRDYSWMVHDEAQSGAGRGPSGGLPGGRSAQEYMQWLATLEGPAKAGAGMGGMFSGAGGVGLDGFGTGAGKLPTELATASGLSIFEDGQMVGDIAEVYDVWADKAEEINRTMEQQRAVIDGLAVSMEHLFLNVMADAIPVLQDMGRALATGGDAAKVFQDGLGDMVSAFLLAMPQLLLQAGINALATPGMFYVGLGLIAASGLTAILGGALDGMRNGGDAIPDNQSAQAASGPSETYYVYGDIYSEDRFERRTSSVASRSGRSY